MENISKIYEWIYGDQILAGFIGLSPRERAIIEMRYGLIDGEKHTLDEVGKKFGVSRGRIQQIEQKVLERMQTKFEEEICKANGFIKSEKFVPKNVLYRGEKLVKNLHD